MKRPTDRAAHLAGELRVLLGTLRRRLREQAAQGDLSLSQLAALGTLDREGAATVTSLARAEGVRPQSMGATVDALEQAGLVSGSPDPRDGRQVLLSLTPRASDYLAAHRAAREDWLARSIRDHLDARQQEVLATAVELLRRIVD